MLDKTTFTSTFTVSEREIFSRARAADNNLRRSFEAWIDVGHAVVVARRHSADERTVKARTARFRAILNAEGIGWCCLPAAELSQLIFDRAPAKAWALRRALAVIETSRIAKVRSVSASLWIAAQVYT